MRLILSIAVLLALTAPLSAQGSISIDAGAEMINAPVDEASPQDTQNRTVPVVYFGGGYQHGSFVVRADLGYSWFTGTRVSVIDGIPPTPGYYWDSSVNRCRNASNGQFAATSLCGREGSRYEHDYDAAYGSISAEGGLTYGIGDHQLHPSVTGLIGLIYLEGPYDKQITPYLALEADAPLLDNGAASLAIRARGMAGSQGFRRVTIGTVLRFN